MINIFKWIKDYRKRHCNHKKVVVAIYVTPIERKFKGRMTTRYNVYRQWVCTKCESKLKTALIERKITANQLISKYGIKP